MFPVVLLVIRLQQHLNGLEQIHLLLVFRNFRDNFFSQQLLPLPSRVIRERFI